VLIGARVASPQVIDFETLPGGTATADQQPISSEYEVAFGVTFALVDPINPHQTIGSPKIAKVGPPRTAFFGCDGGEDNPAPGQGLGDSFLTDDETIGQVASDLLISYSTPVENASGVLIDIDCGQGQSVCEQWTIFARDSESNVLDTVILNAPTGPNSADCPSPGNPGPGNGKAFGWFFSLPGEQISSILIKYTGTQMGVGIAFDRFSPSLPCVCVGDLNLDFTRNGADIQKFAACFVGAGSICGCADMNRDGNLNTIDVSLFVSGLLLPGTCP